MLGALCAINMRPSLIIILFCLCFSSIAQLNKVGNTPFKIKAKLIEVVPFPPSCGTLTFAIAQKFEVLSADHLKKSFNYILIVQQCPELLGVNFFKADSTYEIKVSPKSDGTPEGSYRNYYKKENLKKFWSIDIIKLD